MIRRTICVLLAVAGALSCQTYDPGAHDGATADGASEVDVAADAPRDATPDAPDAALDATPEAATDAGLDAADAPADENAADAPLDVPPDLPRDTGPTPVTVAFQTGVSPTSAYNGTSDSYISEASPTTNYGTSIHCWTDGDSLNDGTSKDQYSLFRWDISAIPSGSTVQSASIVFTVTDPNGPTTNSYQAYSLERAWIESEVTWQRATTGSAWLLPGAAGGTERGSVALFNVSAPTVGPFTVTLTGPALMLVQRWVSYPATNYGIILANTTAPDGLGINSREFTDADAGASQGADTRPRLSVTYAP